MASSRATPRHDHDVEHYATLGVNKKASSEDIKKAFRNLALQCHPDKLAETNEGGQLDGTLDRFLRIQKSYEVLSNEQSRRAYDLSRREADLQQTSVVNEVLTVEEMCFDEDDLTYRISCRCGGQYMVDYPVEFTQDIPCDTCSLTVTLCGSAAEATEEENHSRRQNEPSRKKNPPN